MSTDAMRVGLTKASEDELLMPETLVLKAEQWIKRRMKSVWYYSKDEAVCSYNDAVTELSWDKSPGYPYYYDCDSKWDAMVRYPDIVREKVTGLLNGEDVSCYFALTEKSELRQEEKVKANKTRVFMASDMHHLLASIMLFKKQNEVLIDQRQDTPSTIGIRIPGPEFVQVLSSLGSMLNDGDVSGCDQRYKLRIARVVRNLRKAFIPDRFHACVDTLYDYVYAGACAGLGGIYRIYGNKSGWFNTGHDNTLMTWICFVIASFHFYPDRDPEEVMSLLINGDDLAVCQKLGNFQEFCLWLKKYNFVVEANDWVPRPPSEIVYLSHHIEQRYVSGFGSFLCAAGNYNKIICSLNWIKKSQTLTFEESCVAHLVGLRMCLFPWAIAFEECDKLLSHYLTTIVHTPFIKGCLKARFSERDFAILHTRVEGFSFFPNIPAQIAPHCLVSLY